MRVAVVNITGGSLSGGYRKYLGTLMPRLRDDSRISSLLVAVPPREQEGFREILPDSIAWEEGDQRRRFSGLRAKIMEWKPDVVFIPNSAWQSFNSIPVVTMVRNMEMVAMPVGGNSMVDITKNLLRRWRAKRSCQHSDRVIAISHFVRDYLVQHWSLPPERIGLVYFGVDTPDSSGLDTIRRFGLEGRNFILAAGSVRPYRGLEDAIIAMSHLPSNYESLILVIAGQPDPGSEWYESRMRRLALRLGVSSRIIWTGSLRPKELGQVMFAAKSFIMTSRVEACPNIALEAMAAQARIISTNCKPMPEFFGDVAEYYDAGNGSALASCIAKVLSEKPEADQLNRMKAAAVASRFSWIDTAKQTVNELETAIANYRFK